MRSRMAFVRVGPVTVQRGPRSEALPARVGPRRRHGRITVQLNQCCARYRGCPLTSLSSWPVRRPIGLVVEEARGHVVRRPQAVVRDAVKVRPTDERLVVVLLPHQCKQATAKRIRALHGQPAVVGSNSLDDTVSYQSRPHRPRYLDG